MQWKRWLGRGGTRGRCSILSRGAAGRGSPQSPPADEGPRLRKMGRRISMQEWSPLANKLA